MQQCENFFHRKSLCVSHQVEALRDTGRLPMLPFPRETRGLGGMAPPSGHLWQERWALWPRESGREVWTEGIPDPECQGENWEHLCYCWWNRKGGIILKSLTVTYQYVTFKVLENTKKIFLTLQLTLEQHRFQRHGSIDTWTFFFFFLISRVIETYFLLWFS